MDNKNILILYQVRIGNNLGPPTQAGEILSIFLIAIISYKTRTYDIGLAIDIFVAYLLSKL